MQAGQSAAHFTPSQGVRCHMDLEIVHPRTFFELLYEDEDFCNQLGKLVLAASVFESSLRLFLLSRKVAGINKKTTLGPMIKALQKNNLVKSNSEVDFKDMLIKRNYLIHNLYALFSQEIEATLLPRDGLVELDVFQFAEKARNEATDFRCFAEEIIEATEIEGAIL